MAAEKQKCMIIGASPILDGRVFQEFDPKDYFVICADGGYETALKLGLVPDLVVGDFDSAQKRPPASLRTLVLPVEKDVTDTMFAALKGLAKGLRDFVLLGCLGGPRFDHSLASIETLLYLRDHGAWGFLADERTKVFLLREEKLRISQAEGATVSVLPLRLPHLHGDLHRPAVPPHPGQPDRRRPAYGVSNSIVSDDAEIKVHSGTALVAVYQP